MLVVADHLNFGPFKGGFLGVDIFFVISGFLITSLLADEFARTQTASSAGRISVKGFYVRRARRILPASLLVIAAVLLAAKFTWGPFRFVTVQSDALWATIFMSNFGQMRHTINYFAQGVAVSPLQNYWSLAVEEQFYVVWPVIFMLAARLGWKKRGVGKRSWRGQATAAIVALTAVSLAWSVVQTASNPHLAYFSPFTRGWELGMGALTAMVAPRLSNWINPRAAASLGVLGLALIGIGLVVIGPSTPYPGLIALIPVLGAVSLIVGGLEQPSRTPAGALLSVSPIRLIGRISFSIYLWHWPIIVFAQSQDRATGLFSVSQPFAVLAVTMVISWLSYELIEQPFRTVGKGSGGLRRFLSIPRSRLGWLKLGLMACVALATLGTIALLAKPDSKERHRGHAAVALSAINPSDVVSDGPSAERLKAIKQGLGVNIASSAQMVLIGNEVHSDHHFDFCTAQARALSLAEADCTLPTHGAGVGLARLSGKRVLILGNSFAGQWQQRIAELLPKSSRLSSLTVGACSPLELGGSTPHTSLDNVNCKAWANWELAQAQRLKPSLVIISSRSDTNPTTGASQALTTLLRSVRQTGAKLLWISSLPLAPSWTSCVDASTEVTQCSLTATEAQRPIDTYIQSQVEAEGSHYWDLKPLFCTSQGCPAILKGKPVRQDGSHLSNWATADVAPQLNAAIIASLNSSGSRARPSQVQVTR